MPYATGQDVADYLAVDEGSLPSDIDRLLERASEDVDYWTRGRAALASMDGAVAVKNAVCALIENWMKGGEPTAAATGDISSYTAGKVSVTYATGGGVSSAKSVQSPAGNKLPPRAYQFLLNAGLLSAGVPML